MVAVPVAPTLDSLSIELVAKAPYSGSGPRGIDVYARKLYDELSLIHNLEKLHITRDGKSHLPVDIVHYTFFDPFFLTLWGHPARGRVVVTVHDLIPLKFPMYFPVGIRGRLKWLLQRRALQQVDAVVTDSEASKLDLTTLAGVSADRIHVVPLAAGHTTVTSKLVRAVREEYHLPEKYFLYVGDINWNKNIPGLIQAFAKLKDKTTDLVLVGKAFISHADIPESRAIDQAIAQSGAAASRIHRLGFVPGHHLPALYKAATLYIQPSWYEGFGLTVLEAMEQGCPVVVAKTGSLPEVGGPYAHYFDPAKDKDLPTLLTRLLTSESLREMYCDAGKKWAQSFTWRKSAIATRAVYAAVMAESR